MNRRNFILTTSFATASSLTPSAFASHDGKIGAIDAAEWTKLNHEAGEKMKALKPDGGKLSESDQKLLLEIAMGGMMQHQLSKVALAKSSSADVKAYAQAEVYEQTGLAAKLMELAAAKGVAVPEMPHASIKKAIEALNAKSAAKFDHEYLQQAGVEGHQRLAKTMGEVEAKAADATLKMIAFTALPLIKIHLQAARDEMNDKG